MTTFNIYDAANPAQPIGQQDAADAIVALADYAVSKGYADPRKSEDGPAYFSVWFDGTQGMVFENTELCAVETVALDRFELPA